MTQGRFYKYEILSFKKKNIFFVSSFYKKKKLLIQHSSKLFIACFILHLKDISAMLPFLSVILEGC